MDIGIFEKIKAEPLKFRIQWEIRVQARLGKLIDTRFDWKV